MYGMVKEDARAPAEEFCRYKERRYKIECSCTLLLPREVIYSLGCSLLECADCQGSLPSATASIIDAFSNVSNQQRSEKFHSIASRRLYCLLAAKPTGKLAADHMKLCLRHIPRDNEIILEPPVALDPMATVEMDSSICERF